MWGGWGSNPRPADYEKHGFVQYVRASCTDTSGAVSKRAINL